MSHLVLYAVLSGMARTSIMNFNMIENPRTHQDDRNTQELIDFHIDKVIRSIESNDMNLFSQQLKVASLDDVKSHLDLISIQLAQHGAAREDFQRLLDQTNFIESLYLPDYSWELFDRVNKLDVKRVKFLCENLAANVKKSYNGKTCFFLAILKWCETSEENKIKIEQIKSILEILLRKAPDIKNFKVQIDENSDEIMTPLTYAVIKEKWIIVEFLLQKDAAIENAEIFNRIQPQDPEINKNIIKQMNEYKNKLHLFTLLSEKNEDDFIEYFNNSNGDVNSENGTYTFLQLACINNLAKVVKFLIENHVNINKYSGEPYHSLVLAAIHGTNEFFNSLVETLKGTNENINIENTNCIDLLTTTHICGGTIIQNLAYYWINLQNISSETKENVKILVEKAVASKIDINNKSILLKTALRVSSTANDKYLFILLLNNGAFRSLDSVCISNIKPELLEEYLNSKIKILNIEKIYLKISKKLTNQNVILNYDFMSSNNIENLSEMSPIFTISQSQEHQYLLEHPIIVNFLHLKWLKLYKKYLLANILLFFIFTLSISTYILTFDFNQILVNNSTISNPIDNVNTKEILYWINFITIVLLLILLIIRELFQILLTKINYFKNLENWLEIIVILCTILVLCNSSFFYLISVKNISAILIIVAYMLLILIFGKYPRISKYSTMFINVAKKTVKILLCFLPSILAFAFGFYIIFYSIPENQFENISISLRKTIIMIIGEIDIEPTGIENNGTIIGIVVLIFIILMTIILMNLINALAISDTQSVIDKAKRYCLLSNIKLYTELETICDETNTSFTLFGINFPLIFNFIEKIRNYQLQRSKVFPLENHNKDGIFLILYKNKCNPSIPNICGGSVKQSFYRFVLGVDFDCIYEACCKIKNDNVN